MRLALAAMAFLAACSPSAPPAQPPAEVTVFAASSLADAFGEIGRGFEAAHPGVKVTFNFGGSQTLRTQLEQGARADVFASANQKEMDAAVAAALVSGGAGRVFARNRLVVITPAANPGRVAMLEDLARPGLKIVLAAENVPVGEYTRESLAKMTPQFGSGFDRRVLANVVSNEDNVKQVLAKVQLGEADAGIVYASDVTPTVSPHVQTLDIPDEFNVEAAYLIGVLTSARHPDLAAQFAAYVLSKDGQASLQKWGLGPLQP